MNWAGVLICWLLCRVTPVSASPHSIERPCGADDVDPVRVLTSATAADRTGEAGWLSCPMTSSSPATRTRTAPCPSSCGSRWGPTESSLKAGDVAAHEQGLLPPRRGVAGRRRDRRARAGAGLRQPRRSDRPRRSTGAARTARSSSSPGPRAARSSSGRAPARRSRPAPTCRSRRPGPRAASRRPRDPRRQPRALRRGRFSQQQAHAPARHPRRRRLRRRGRRQSSPLSSASASPTSSSTLTNGKLRYSLAELSGMPARPSWSRTATRASSRSPTSDRQ